MEPSKQIASNKEAVIFVNDNYPPGTKLKHKPSGALYMIGVRWRNYFWMMPLDKAEKRLVPAKQVVRDFESNAL